MMSTEKEGDDLYHVWKKYRWHYRPIDPEDMAYIDRMTGTSMDFRFSYDEDGRLCARIRVPHRSAS